MTSLQTGLIDGFMDTPVFALSLQIFAKAPHMINASYGIAIGGAFGSIVVVRTSPARSMRRTSADVVLKWFARGQLWESPEQAHAAAASRKRPSLPEVRPAR